VTASVRTRAAVTLEARDVRKAYRSPRGEPIEILAGVNLAVKAGELVVVVGASGSGKSTLLNVLGLLEDPDGGEVAYDGRVVSGLSRSAMSRARGRFVGFVFQGFLLLPSLTALENVVLAARYVGGDRVAARARALRLLDELGVGHRRDHFPPQLSGGEQQRVAFCRAILNDPPLLLADEPIGNLDDDNGRVIVDRLRRRAEGGGAVVVVSHRTEGLGDARAVYRIERGALAAVPA
jgi:ABC-type lipoprotein export system ATPase subunit